MLEASQCFKCARMVVGSEVMAYGCFCELMHRMAANFPHGGQMDIHFANMRALIQVE